MVARYKYRFYATDQQKNSLAKLFGCARYVWNEALAHCQAVGKYLGYNQLSSRLTKLKESVQWLKEVSSVALQQSLRHLEEAYQKFFNKEGGAPRYKKRKTNQSATLMSREFQVNNDVVW